ncbi:MAG: Coq4 family protein [Pseudomonadota bacterium]
MKQTPAATLREGLSAYYQANAAVFSDREAAPEVAEFFRCHDAAHVVFGCDTSLYGEGILKIFTIFGTTLGFWKHLSAYSEASAFSLFRQYRITHLARHILRLLAYAPRAVLNARRMSQPWPWSDYGRYLDRSIEEIRREFNIQVVSSD